MDANEYQARAGSFARYPGQGKMLGLFYTAFGVGGESGEALEKVKKLLRDTFKDMTDEQIAQRILSREPIPEETRQAIKKELGDAQWYIANMAAELKFTLGEVMQSNIEKLDSRNVRNVLHGSGDNR